MTAEDLNPDLLAEAHCRHRHPGLWRSYSDWEDRTEPCEECAGDMVIVRTCLVGIFTTSREKVAARMRVLAQRRDETADEFTRRQADTALRVLVEAVQATTSSPDREA